MQQQSTGKTPRNAPSALWRERVIAVGVALTDAAITALDKHLAALVLGDIQSASTRLLLCAMDEGKMAFLTTCYTLRLSMSRCYNDNPSPNDGHAQQLADIARKMPVCMEAISVNCSGCCGY